MAMKNQFSKVHLGPRAAKAYKDIENIYLKESSRQGPFHHESTQQKPVKIATRSRFKNRSDTPS